MAGLLLMLYACSDGGSSKETEKSSSTESAKEEKHEASEDKHEASEESSELGIGKFKDIKLDPTLNKEMATKGQNVYDVKCGSCHKLTDERLVGPGWKGVTSRHKPEWIMNFATNVEEMLNKDPKAQAMLEMCLVRMPNQSLTDDDARSVLEFMRKNDGVK